MSLLDAISGGLTTGTQAAAAHEAGELQGKRLTSQLLSAALGQDEKRAQIDWYKSRANSTTAKTPTAADYEQLRTSLVEAGHDPDAVDAAIRASRVGDRTGLHALLTPPKTPPTRYLRTPGGYVEATPGQAPKLLSGLDGTPVMPVIARGAGRAANPNAEPLAHRAARQGLNAVNSQIKDTRDQMRAMDRAAPPLVQFPGVVTGTPADSATARDFTAKRHRLQARADSLRGVGDQLAGQLSTSGATVAPGAPAGGSKTSARPAQPDYDSEAKLYQGALARIRQRYSGAEATRRIQAATDRYNERVGALAKGSR